MRAARCLVAGPVVTLVLLLALTSTATAAAPDPDATLKVTETITVARQTKETPIAGGGTSYYCAVGAFVPFSDRAGWRPVSADYLFIDRPASERIGDPPYDDASQINGLVFAPAAGRHHVQLGDFSYGQGGSPSLLDECVAMEGRVNGFFGDTATVTYEHTATCAAAIGKLLPARAAVTRAAKRARNTTGRAHDAAVAALKRAKTTLTKATKTYRAQCR